MKTRVLLVALDGATPAIISAPLDRGELPNLRRIVESGCSGTLVARPPLVRSIAWTTLATGRCAPRHGVCGNLAVRPDGAGVQPAGHAAWRVPAVWELLSAAGYVCATIGWPATAPASAWSSGVIVDDAYAEPLGPGFDAWPLLPDCVSPEEWRDALRPLRVHPGDITSPDISALVPRGQLVDQDTDSRLTHIALALARTSTLHAAATHVAAEYEWDFLAVAYPLLADVQRQFLSFRPPRLSGVDDDDVEIYAPVVDIAHRIQDAMLGALLKVVDAQTTVFIVSPYGFAAGVDRPDVKAAANLPPSIAWHRNQGFLAAAGPGVEADALVHDARVEDIAPTVLNVFGLAYAEHDGRCIGAVSRPVVHARSISVPKRSDEAASMALLDVERAGLESRQLQAVERATIAWLVNTAESHLALGEYGSAADAYTRLVEWCPDDWLAKARLARCCLHLGDLGRCRTLAAEVIATKPDIPWGYLLGAAGLVLDGQPEKADSYLAQAREKGRDLPNVSLRLGLLHLLCHDFTQAETLFREALKSMPRSVEAHDGLGCALYAQERHGEAVAAFRAGLGHFFHYPLAYLHLAMALASLGRYEEAAEAARTALGQDAAVPGGEELLERVTRACEANKASSARDRSSR